MDRLPHELLLLIAQEVPYESLEPLRLVNRAFAATAAPHLFKSIPIWINVSSMERLAAIAEHPQLSKYPKEIFFSPISFIDHENRTLYQDRIKVILEQRHPHRSSSMRALAIAKHMSAYRGYVSMQRFLSMNALDVAILSTVFSQLPNLETLQIGLWDPTIGSAEVLRAFGTFNPRYLLTFGCSHTLPILIKALAKSTTNIKALKLVGNSFRSDSSLSASISADRFSFPVGLSIRALSETFGDENMDTCKDALRCVRELKIRSIWSETNNPFSLSMIGSALQKLMQYTQGLEVLTLDGIGTDLPGVMLRHRLNILISSSVLNSIQELNLRYIHTTIVALCDLFRKNRYTLIKARFTHVTINAGDWSTALTQLRTIDFPRLKVFILSCSIDEVQVDLQVQDYILKKTNKSPLEKKGE